MTDIDAINQILRRRASPLLGQIPSTHLDAQVLATLREWDEADAREFPDDDEMMARWAWEVDKARCRFYDAVTNAKMADPIPLIAATARILPGYRNPRPSVDARGCAIVRADLILDLRVEVTWAVNEDGSPVIVAEIMRGREDVYGGSVEAVRSWVESQASGLRELVEAR